MIAVTGIGIVSPIGTGKEQVLASLAGAVSGISRDNEFKVQGSGISSFGCVKGFVPKDHIPPMKARRMSKFSLFSLASAIEAVRDAGLEISDRNRFSTGIAVGTGLASTDSTDRFYEGLLKGGPDSTNPMVFPETVQNIAASHISIHMGTRGPNITFSHADISSELALFYGCELLKDGRADAVIISGADELSVSSATGYSSLGLLSDAMMPFDNARNGFVLAEGGATLVIERLEDAKKRNADIYCRISASAFSSSPATTMHYDSSRQSMVRAMQSALAQAGIPRPGFISAAANATRQLDRLETEAVKEVFGSTAYEIPLSAARSYYGFFSADGMLRTAAAALCLKHGIVPKTLGLKTPAPECDLDYVTEGIRNADLSTVMVNSFSAGGTSSSTILSENR